MLCFRPMLFSYDHGAGGGLDPPHTPYKDEVEDEEEIAEVEMVLETYFMHVDNTYNKLQTLCEYIDDTEVRFGDWTHVACYIFEELACSGAICEKMAG